MSKRNVYSSTVEKQFHMLQHLVSSYNRTPLQSPLSKAKTQKKNRFDGPVHKHINAKWPR
jgi:hypothetical protein